MKFRPHGNDWYDRLALVQKGYYYPWRSTVAASNGEDAYLELVRQHLTSNCDVLDAGCGHGALTLELAPLCRTIRGYDRVKSYIDIAVEALRKHGADNIEFTCFNSHANANDGHVRVPAADRSIDVVVSRRGPTHWIEDVRRFCRLGAVLIQLNPLDHTLEPAWNHDVSTALQLPPPDPDSDRNMRHVIEGRLSLVDLRLHSAWTFDVPEWFDQPRDLYRFLAFGKDSNDVPPWSDVADELQQVFSRHAGPHGLECRQRRFLWKAIVE